MLIYLVARKIFKTFFFFPSETGNAIAWLYSKNIFTEVSFAEQSLI